MEKQVLSDLQPDELTVGLAEQAPETNGRLFDSLKSVIDVVYDQTELKCQQCEQVYIQALLQIKKNISRQHDAAIEVQLELLEGLYLDFISQYDDIVHTIDQYEGQLQAFTSDVTMSDLVAQPAMRTRINHLQLVLLESVKDLQARFEVLQAYVLVTLEQTDSERLYPN